jgi:predicted TIM-barrel fold metal-dependent hydrolase
MMNHLSRDLYNEIRKLPVIDTHEHLVWDEEIRCADRNDVLGEYLLHYMKSDLLSAGMKPGDMQFAVDSDKDLTERWKLLEPWWEYCRYTGYGRALDIAVRGIYGIDGINSGTIKALNDAFLAQKKPGHFSHVLRDLCGIETCVVDIWTFHIDNKVPMFKAAWQPQNFIQPSEPFGKDLFVHIREKHGITVASLDDWLEALEREIELVLRLYGARTIKSAIAYHRPLRFEKITYAEAKALFEEALGKWERARADKEPMLEFPLKLQDFLMHYTMQIANKLRLTVQFHTGLFEGSGNVLSNGNPELLTNLFIDYPDVDFDLFHISYPYQSKACALAKMFPNVYIDMCWAHIISPSASVAALGDFLDAVPYNKISAFGGDYLFVDGVYGHLEIARQNVSSVLADKVEKGVFTEAKALEIAKALFYDNPKRILKL